MILTVGRLAAERFAQPSLTFSAPRATFVLGLVLLKRQNEMVVDAKYALTLTQMNLINGVPRYYLS